MNKSFLESIKSFSGWLWVLQWRIFELETKPLFDEI